MKLFVQAHCRDCFVVSGTTDDGREIDYDGYVLNCLTTDNGFGDDLILQIDTKTGKILNWKFPTDDDIVEQTTPEPRRY